MRDVSLDDTNLMHEGEPHLPDRRREIRQPHWLTRFLWWCSGSVPELVRQSPTEWSRHAGIGGAVLSTWCLASFAGGYALYTMTADTELQVLVSVLGGVVWGLIIFNIDRFLVSSLRKRGERSFAAVVKSELLPASPRILFAVVIALTIAEPIEMRLFSSEIEDRVEANRDQLVADRQASLRRLAEPQAAIWRQELAQLDAGMNASREKVEALQREYIEESDGRSGSRRVGDGPLTEIKRTEMERAAADHQALIGFAAPRRAELQERLDQSELTTREQLTAYRASLGSGYLARREALTNLYNERPGVWGAVWGIFALMVMVEITPLLLKIFGAYGPYDAKLALAEDSDVHEAQLENDYRATMAKYHYQLAADAERAFEDASHESSIAVRTAKARQAWASFDGGFSVRSYPSVDRLLRHLREALSMHRNS
jgi:hypothetical protein